MIILHLFSLVYYLKKTVGDETIKEILETAQISAKIIRGLVETNVL
jgi:hypothetical protein